jgi:hypothetical protein
MLPSIIAFPNNPEQLCDYESVKERFAGFELMKSRKTLSTLLRLLQEELPGEPLAQHPVIIQTALKHALRKDLLLEKPGIRYQVMRPEAFSEN